MSKSEHSKLLSEYTARVKDINAKHKRALEIAAGIYQKGMARLNKQDAAKLAKLAGGATVGKPPRSKGHGTRSRS